jgi:hypothetical protein
MVPLEADEFLKKVSRLFSVAGVAALVGVIATIAALAWAVWWIVSHLQWS